MSSRTRIKPQFQQKEGSALPAGAMFTQILTQQMLESAMSAMGRPLTVREVQLLDNVVTREHQRRLGLSMPTTDELTARFVAESKRN